MFRRWILPLGMGIMLGLAGALLALATAVGGSSSGSPRAFAPPSVPVVASTPITLSLVAKEVTTSSPVSPTVPSAVRAPVVLDGVRYSHEEYGRIQAELRSKEIYFRSVALPDPETGVMTLYSFTTDEKMNEFVVSRGLPPIRPGIAEMLRERAKRDGLIGCGSIIVGVGSTLPPPPPDRSSCLER